MLRYFAPQKCTADDDVEGMVRKMNDLLWKLSK